MTGPRPQPFAAFVAALLLAVPAASSAQPRTAPAVKPAGKTTPLPAAAKPTAAAVVAPAPEPAAPPFEEKGPWRIGAALGWENDSDAELKGPRVQVELERDLVALGSRGQLSFVAAAAWFRGARDDSTTILGVTIESDTVQNLLEVVPSFRASFALKPRLRVFAELGVGGGWAKATVETTVSTVPDEVFEASVDDTFGVLRLSAGGTYQLNDRLRVGVLAPTLTRRYAGATAQSLSFSAMAAYAF